MPNFNIACPLWRSFGSFCMICKLFTDENGQNETILVAVTIPETGHTPAEVVKENVNDPTCTVDGSYDEVVYCSVCDYEISRTPKTTDATGHTPAEAVKENVVDPTCTVDGSYDEVVYCEICDSEISRTPKTTDATGHSFTNYISNGDADCLNDGTKTAECDNGCGETDTVDDVDSKTGHKWSTKYTYDKNYHWHECEHTYCPVTNDSDKDGYAAHISNGEATEDNDEHCTVCGYVINPTFLNYAGMFLVIQIYIIYIKRFLQMFFLTGERSTIIMNF